MKAARIVNGIVANVIEVATLDALPDLVSAIGSDGKRASVGYLYDAQAHTFTAPQPTAEELRIAEIENEISGDSTLAALKAMTAAEFDQWFTDNVTNLAQARNVLQRLCRIVLRRVL